MRLELWLTRSSPGDAEPSILLDGPVNTRNFGSYGSPGAVQSESSSVTNLWTTGHSQLFPPLIEKISITMEPASSFVTGKLHIRSSRAFISKHSEVVSSCITTSERSTSPLYKILTPDPQDFNPLRLVIRSAHTHILDGTVNRAWAVGGVFLDTLCVFHICNGQSVIRSGIIENIRVVVLQVVLELHFSRFHSGEHLHTFLRFFALEQDGCRAIRERGRSNVRVLRSSSHPHCDYLLALNVVMVPCFTTCGAKQLSCTSLLRV